MAVRGVHESHLGFHAEEEDISLLAIGYESSSRIAYSLY